LNIFPSPTVALWILSFPIVITALQFHNCFVSCELPIDYIKMKTSTIIAILVACAAAADLKSSSCSATCVEKIVYADGCGREDFQCHCSKPGLIRQLQPCLQSACTDAGALEEAKAAFTQECKAAGVKVKFVSASVEHFDMARRADSSSGSGDSNDGMSHGSVGSATSAVAKPAKGTSTSTAYRNVVSGHASVTGTRTRGVNPAVYTGAVAPREVAGSMLGFVAAVAAAAAI